MFTSQKNHSYFDKLPMLAIVVFLACSVAGSEQAGNVPQGLTAGDFNDDGHLDLAVSNSFDDTISILTGSGTGNFSETQIVSVDKSPGLGDDQPRQLIIADFNNDGVDDLAVINSGNPGLFTQPSIAIIEGNRKGTFQPSRWYPDLAVSGNPLTPFALTAGLFNRDALLDLVVAHYGSNEIVYLENDGSFLFDDGIETSIVTSSGGPAAILSADINLDGKTDLLLANDADLMLLPGNGNGTFTSAQTIATGLSWSDIAVSDFNNDGDLDLVAADSSNSLISAFLGLTISGGFSIRIDSALPFTGASALATGDFNQDGYEDVAVAFLNNAQAGILSGKGNGSFNFASAFATGDEPRDIIAADFNKDGLTDWASANEGDEFDLNNEDITIQLNFSQPVTNLTSIKIADENMPSQLGAGIKSIGGAGWHLDRNSLYVCSPEEPAIVEISPWGMRLSTIDTSVFGSYDPSDVIIHPASGDLLFCDRAETMVYRVKTDGNFVSSFSTAGAGATKPSGIAWQASSSRLIICDEYQDRAFAFSLTGSLHKTYSADNPLIDIAIDPVSGFLWGFDEGEDELKAFSFNEGDSKLESEDSFDIKDASELLEKQQLTGVALNPSTKCFFLFGPHGLMIESPKGGPAVNSIDLGIGVEFAAADHDPATGDLWLLDAGLLGSVIKRDSAGAFSLEFQTQSHSTNNPFVPRGLAFGNGSVFIAGDKQNKILKFSTGGALQNTIAIPWHNKRNVRGLEFDEGTNSLLLMTDGRIYESDVTGSLLATHKITRVRSFSDLSLNEAANQIALYASNGEVWFVDRNGQFLSRSSTPDFYPAGYKLNAGTATANLHWSFGSNSKQLSIFQVTPLNPSGSSNWTMYR